ncbi:MAG: hypothetical protein WCI93_01935 [bacterium]
MENLTLKEAIKLQRRLYDTVIICCIVVASFCLFIFFTTANYTGLSDSDIIIQKIIRMIIFTNGFITLLILLIFWLSKPKISEKK